LDFHHDGEVGSLPRAGENRRGKERRRLRGGVRGRNLTVRIGLKCTRNADLITIVRKHERANEKGEMPFVVKGCCRCGRRKKKLERSKR
jgi:hypothetical protein